jgi:hypothetical protein
VRRRCSKYTGPVIDWATSEDHMKLTRLFGAAALIAGLSFSSTAQAAPINATGSVGVLGISNDPAGVIGMDTTFTFAFSLFSSGTGDLIVVPTGSLLTTAAITSTVGTPVNFSAAWGSFAGFVTEASAEGPSSNRVVDVVALGTFTPLSGPPDLSAFDPGPMSLTFSATQTGGAGASVSASYSIASPPAGVPEPMTMTLLGLGLVGSAAAARRRRRS